MADAAVEVLTASGNQVDRTGTDANGAFRFTRLQVGDYKLSFDWNGNVQWAHGKTTPEEADAIAVRAGEETTVTETAFPTGDLEVTIVVRMIGVHRQPEVSGPLLISVAAQKASISLDLRHGAALPPSMGAGRCNRLLRSVR